MNLFWIGCIVGIGKVLPGISGSVLAIRLGIYEKTIDSIIHFLDNPKENMKFLMILGSGFSIATIIGSKLLLHFFVRYSIFLKILFFLFILTGLPNLLKKCTSYPILIFSFIMVSGLLFLPSHSFSINYFFMGFIEAFSTIVPGISGTAIFLSLGWYEEILTLFSEFYLFPFQKLIPFFLGILFCSYFLLKGIHYLLKKYPGYTYSAIVGFLLSSLFFVF
jgi:putative membrane protein